MKQLCILSHEDDYFARDALMGEIEKHRTDIAFYAAELADGFVLIAGINAMQPGEMEKILAQRTHKEKPLLVLVSHKENETAVRTALPGQRCAAWEWPAINSFLDGL